MSKISDCFNMNFVCLKIFGLWSGNKPSKYYKYYSAIYLFITLPIYFSLLSLNLVYTPKKLEVLIYELIYYFTEFSVLAKVFMMLRKRKKLLEVMNLLNCEAFNTDDDKSSAIINRYVYIYTNYWKAYSLLSHLAYFARSIGPLARFILETNIELPSVSVDLILTLTPFSSAMILQIFVPSYLGTQLSYKSEELVNAAYTSEWIHRSESFKRSLKLFMQRAQLKISLTGCGLLPLTLSTFTSIMKTAYSFFTLIRNFQDRD
ncbi:unnamed protein product [Colias eurytheme]|nr:unnamed protein product [Colias eurytheme]